MWQNDGVEVVGGTNATYIVCKVAGGICHLRVSKWQVEQTLFALFSRW